MTLDDLIEVVDEAYKILHKMAKKINDLAEVSNGYCDAFEVMHKKFEEIFKAHNDLVAKVKELEKRPKEK